MTDNEIIKAWEKILSIGDAPIGEHWSVGGIVTTRFAKDTLDMLNRQKAEIEKLNVELFGMRCACESYKLHYDNAQAKIERLNKVSEICGECHTNYAKKIERAKFEAYKELAEIVVSDYPETDYYLEKLLKELTEGGNEDGMD